MQLHHRRVLGLIHDLWTLANRDSRFSRAVIMRATFQSTRPYGPGEIPFDRAFRDLRDCSIELGDRQALEKRLPVGHALTGEFTGKITVLLAARDVLGDRKVVHFQA